VIIGIHISVKRGKELQDSSFVLFREYEKTVQALEKIKPEKAYTIFPQMLI
jgi:hypothetical protein